MSVLHDDCRRGCGHVRISATWRDLLLDIERVVHERGVPPGQTSSFRRRLSAFLTPHVLCVFLYRVSHVMYARRWGRLARLAGWANLIHSKATLTPASCIAGGLFIPHPTGIVFHGRAGVNLTLYACALCCSLQAPQWSSVEDGPTLGDRVTIGVHGAVLGPVKVGSDTVVAFRTDLTRDAPANSVVASRHSCVSGRQII